MKRHVLVIDNSNGPDLDLKGFVDALDPGARMYSMDGRVCFVTSELSASEISKRFLSIAGSRLFFVADVTSADCAGRMFGGFWDFMKRPALPAAAE